MDTARKPHLTLIDATNAAAVLQPGDTMEYREKDGKHCILFQRKEVWLHLRTEFCSYPFMNVAVKSPLDFQELGSWVAAFTGLGIQFESRHSFLGTFIAQS